MTTATLFGLALAPLYAAIAQVESDNGKTSSNIYQIDVGASVYISDVNRIYERNCKLLGLAYRPFQVQAKFSRNHSEEMMRIYWAYYGRLYEEKTGNPVTYEVLARIHNGGPNGWSKPYTLDYWRKVETVMKGGVK